MEKKSQKLLLKLARKTIESYFKKTNYDLELIPPEFKEKRGVFVTLTLNGELKGCIGYIEPIKTIYQAVKENALSAAFNDPRFNPVTEPELAKLRIEISILSQPELLKYSSPVDLLQKLKIGIDGVILRNRGKSATFLPQVWEQLPDKVVFLEHLSRKAGLNKDEWKGAEIKTYQVEYFEE